MHPAFRREIRNKKYEWDDERGLYLGESKVFVNGKFGVERRIGGGDLDGPIAWSDNIVVTEGRNHILDVIYGGGTQIDPWYIGIFKGNYTPVAGDTGTTISSNATESNDYDEAVRQTWVDAAAAGGIKTNSANKATFTMDATVTIYGAFLHEASAKTPDAGYNVGVLSSASKFSTSKSFDDDDECIITYQITITSS